ncbi:MAG: bifunctional 5,10-methylene-tetrahydrofolate dehydrogenase/5,10-methylene-tetrahydrofolate cyclohydrolase [Eubacteriales Family XIII. Incertae Sedis bacterium]|nr:MAG: bifunctional 5,10-methylene-tetrahydrofolate dehydrogenase/5,10-methylene-tetrahydrofolate cyclohydrolase [Clostridiales Family XIII bacterium]PWM69248.1 MAG: bifunctional 5,10-methylene-tetrahydrofolate dehydrogenase/5,10-methylene-tetrahydrofolate cyclohydrolase [Clostridiales Family XIII bacterium]
MTEILKGAPVAASIIEKAARKTERLKEKGIVATLAVVRFGSREDDLAYERGIRKSAERAGISVSLYEMPENAEQREAEALIARLNSCSEIHGILIFKPLPPGIDEKGLQSILSPEKDIDGITDAASASLYSGDGRYAIPCTARACIEMLRHYNIGISGKNAVVIGRSPVIGKPVSLLLLKENATVTICHSKTESLSQICRGAAILIACSGKAEMITKEFMNEKQTIIDVGINFDMDGNMVGDVRFKDADGFVYAAAPVPGGVGTVTTAVLMDNLAEAAMRSAK